MAEIQTGS